jgi:hypothetical protein
MNGIRRPDKRSVIRQNDIKMPDAALPYPAYALAELLLLFTPVIAF